MQLSTKFFGLMEVDESSIFRFSKGLPGFEKIRKFAFIQQKDSVFSILQAVGETEVAFVVISPYVVNPGYDFNLTEDEVAKLKLTKAEDAIVLGVVTIPLEKPEEATVNLQAPVILNRVTGYGIQMILTDGKYSLHQRLWNKDKNQLATG